jgi:hypothetical protein
LIKTAADAASTPDATGTLPSSAPGAAPPQIIADRYEIERELGQGGMGRVYLATDRKLSRKVAIKVLSGAHVPEALERFELEARAAGSLNHPNVLAVYDIGAHESGPYLVSELLEGQTLRQRMTGKPLPLRKALDFAVQLAQGLSAAHEKGVIHRDLKPENLFITSDGRLKILDFGIAKLAGEKQPARPITQTGTIMGTVGYMSPEQVRGEHADHRTDIFSFGVILHEMLSGKAPFEKHTPMETGSAILHDDPPPLPGSVPEQLHSVVERCLEKDARERFQSARDLAFQLASIHVTGTGARSAQGGFSPRLLRRVLVPLAIAAAAAAGYALRSPRPQEPPTSRRLSTTEDEPFTARFAHDGNGVLYTAVRGGKGAMMTTRIDRPHSVRMGLDDAFVLSVSRGGEAALLLHPGAFDNLGVRQGTLAVTHVSGGAPREVSEDVVAADYLPDGSLAMIRHKEFESRYTVEFPAGHPVYTSPTFIGSLRASPDGRYLAYADQPVVGDDRGFIGVVDREGRARRIPGEWFTIQGLAWSPRGDEIWFGGSKESLAELHATTLEGRERVLMRAPAELALMDVDARGRALVRVSNFEYGIRCRAPDSPEERECAAASRSRVADLSRDGRRVLIFDDGEHEGNSYSTYLGRTDGSAPVRLGDGVASALSPDGKWALSMVVAEGNARVVLYPTGAGEPRQIAFDPSLRVTRAVFFPDGKRLAVRIVEGTKPPRLYVRELEGTAMRAIGEAGGALLAVTHDGSAVITRSARSLQLMPVDGRPVRELEVSSTPRWGWAGEDPAGNFLIVDEQSNLAQGTVQVWRVPAAGGKRTLVREFRPPFSDGLIRTAGISDDGKAYAFSYSRIMSRLYLVEGLK